MRGRLLKAWLRLLVVWWLATCVWWAMSDPRIGATLRTLTGHVGAINALDSGIGALRVLLRWSLPHLAAAATATVAGAALVWAGFVLRARLRGYRVRINEQSAWRGMSLSMGELEMPRWAGLPADGIDIKAEGPLADRLAAMTETQQELFSQVLGVLSAHPDAFVGAGHQGTLLEHTLHVLSRLPAGCADPLLPIAAAAHDAGKVLAWRRDGEGQWRRVGWHDDLGGLLLSALPAAPELPANELSILLAALRFAHKREKTPTLPDDADTRRLRAIQDALTEADHTATAAEKKKTLETVDRPTLLRQAFIEVLPVLPFQTAGGKKGVKAAGWRKGDRVYLSEVRLREFMQDALRRLNPDAAAAWAVPRRKGQMAAQTIDLVEVFEAEDWLVSEVDDLRASPALWHVRSGTVDLHGILILDLPPDLLLKLPGDAPYKVAVTAPFYVDGEQAPDPKQASGAIQKAVADDSEDAEPEPAPIEDEPVAPVEKKRPAPKRKARAKEKPTKERNGPPPAASEVERADVASLARRMQDD